MTTLPPTDLALGPVEQLATNFKFTEGPVWHPDGYLRFSDIPANRIYRLTPDGELTVFREPSGNSNGLTLDHQGRLIACEHGNRRVSRTAADGQVTALATHFDGKRLNSPNDVVVHSSGAIFFTDPPYGIKPEQQELDFSGVYRLDPDGSLTLLVDDFLRPNGLAFSPDESRLYVDDSHAQHVRVFDMTADLTLDNGRVFADLQHEGDGVPDGMKIDQEGNTYVTNALGIWIFNPGGDFLGLLSVPETPANCAWGGPNNQTLFLTARTSVYQVQMRIPGMPVMR